MLFDNSLNWCDSAVNCVGNELEESKHLSQKKAKEEVSKEEASGGQAYSEEYNNHYMLKLHLDLLV